MPDVMDWQGDSRAGITRAVEYLRRGRLVVLPTESIYLVVGSALSPDALSAFDHAMGAKAPFMLLLGQAAELFDWLPYTRGAGLRLARRFWPGPMILSSRAGIRQGHFTRLPKAVQQRLGTSRFEATWPEGTTADTPPLGKGGAGGLLPDLRLSLRFPAHPAPGQASRQLGMPLLACPTPYTAPERIVEDFSTHAALIIQDGTTALAQPDTVVQTRGRLLHTVRAGAIPAEEIDAAAPCRIIFVCTGNTCRSPLAEALCKKLLADKLTCLPMELPKYGFLVQSAGLAAMMGCEAAPEAEAVAQEYGTDIRGHQSQPLTAEMVMQADRVYAMTAAHLRVLDGLGSAAPRLLSAAGEDVPDPIGASAEVYRACARQMHGYLEELLPELLEC
jgi:L-threonylcarbamoyladenylate synthase